MDDAGLEDQRAYEGLLEYAGRLEEVNAALEAEVKDLEEEKAELVVQLQRLSELLLRLQNLSPRSSLTTTDGKET